MFTFLLQGMRHRPQHRMYPGGISTHAPVWLSSMFGNPPLVSSTYFLPRGFKGTLCLHSQVRSFCWMVPHPAYGMQGHQTSDYGCFPPSPSPSHSSIVLHALPATLKRTLMPIRALSGTDFCARSDCGGSGEQCPYDKESQNHIHRMLGINKQKHRFIIGLLA